jgi:hypothetical protein
MKEKSIMSIEGLTQYLVDIKKIESVDEFENKVIKRI